jgi:hypothetical protein
MSHKLELFEIGKDFLVDINKDWISTIKEFAKVLRRDRGSPGDSGGHKKLQARKEFTYIYHMYDYKSKFRAYDEEDRRKHALLNSDLPLDFQPDSDLQAAIKVYEKMKVTKTIKSINSVERGLLTAQKTADAINLKLSKFLDILADETSILTVTEEGVEAAARIETISNTTIDLVQKLLKITVEIPKSINLMAELNDKIIAELSDEGTLRAGDKKGVREE